MRPTIIAAAALAAILATEAMAQTLPSIRDGRWNGLRNVDRMTDAVTASISAYSTDDEGCDGQKALLSFVCQNDTLALALRTACAMGAERDTHALHYRVDDGPVAWITAMASGGRDPVFVFRTDHLQALLRRMADGRAVHMRITPPGQTDRTMTFRTEGMAEAAARMDMQCGIVAALVPEQ
jgi:hypothetical protein